MNDSSAPVAQLGAAPAVRQFVLAGNAYFTLRSVLTGTRFTYRVSLGKVRDGDTRPAPHFVKLLTGSDNRSDYTFLGTIFPDGSYRHGRRSRVGEDAPAARGFAFFWRVLSAGRLPERCEFWHEGRCGRCGRALTVPESIALGLGPECAGKMGDAGAELVDDEPPFTASVDGETGHVEYSQASPAAYLRTAGGAL